MKFKINGKTWTISHVKKDWLKQEYCKDHKEPDGECYIFGRCFYPTQEIHINEELCREQAIDTLKHELMHCYLYVNGIRNSEAFTEEDLCNLSSASHDFIEQVIQKYKEQKS